MITILLVVALLIISAILLSFIIRVAKACRRRKALIFGSAALTAAAVGGYKYLEERAKATLSGGRDFNKFDAHLLKLYISVRFPSMRAAYEYAMQQLPTPVQKNKEQPKVDLGLGDDQISSSSSVSMTHIEEDSGSTEEDRGSIVEEEEDGEGGSKEEEEEEDPMGEVPDEQPKQLNPNTPLGRLALGLPPPDLPPPPPIVPPRAAANQLLPPLEALRRNRIKAYFDSFGFQAEKIEYVFKDNSGLDKDMTIDQLLDLARAKAAEAAKLDAPEAKLAKEKAEQIVEEVGFYLKEGPLSATELGHTARTLGLSYIPKATSAPTQSIAQSVVDLVQGSPKYITMAKLDCKSVKKFDISLLLLIAAQSLTSSITENRPGLDPYQETLKLTRCANSWLTTHYQTIIDREASLRSVIFKALQIAWLEPGLVKDIKTIVKQLSDPDRGVQQTAAGSLCRLVNERYPSFLEAQSSNGLSKTKLHKVKNNIMRERGLTYLKTFFMETDGLLTQPSTLQQLCWQYSPFIRQAPLCCYWEFTTYLKGQNQILPSENQARLIRALCDISLISDPKTIEILLALFLDHSIMSKTLAKNRITILKRTAVSSLCPIVLLKKSFRRDLQARILLQATSSLFTRGTLPRGLILSKALVDLTSRTCAQHYAAMWKSVRLGMFKLLMPLPRIGSLCLVSVQDWSRRLMASWLAQRNCQGSN